MEHPLYDTCNIRIMHTTWDDAGRQHVHAAHVQAPASSAMARTFLASCSNPLAGASAHASTHAHQQCHKQTQRRRKRRTRCAPRASHTSKVAIPPTTPTLYISKECVASQALLLHMRRCAPATPLQTKQLNIVDIESVKPKPAFVRCTPILFRKGEVLEGSSLFDVDWRAMHTP